MTKNANTSVLSPDAISLPAYVLADDYVEVIEALNYAAAQAIQSFDWSGKVRAYTTTNVTTLLEFWVWIPPWATQVDVFLTTTASGAAQTTVTVGSAAPWTPPNGQQSTTLNTSSTGTGWRLVTCAANVGSGTLDLDLLHIASKVVSAANLPNPVVE